ncbi:MAG TPA: thiol-disulfide oxidoreductase DCC family protein [Chitinophagales bacterium]|nr:thiol-disulfide oxidoreductase DCC family protein [Chitinophagales bacterium]
MDSAIILFDGVCKLCNASVRFIIKRDKKAYFRFASLQSAFAGDLFRKLNFDSNGVDSIVLYENGKVYVRSTAALKIAKHLSGWWFLIYGCIIFPRFLRDAAYDFIARNRYKWFGKKEFCMVPEPEIKGRFLE